MHRTINLHQRKLWDTARYALLLATLCFSSASWCTVQARQAQVTPPQATSRSHTSTLHGETRVDPYFWLRERTNPEVIAYLEAENRYATATMQHTDTLQERLYAEMLGRIQETDTSVPVKIDDYYYYTRTEAGKQYPLHCRKHGNLDAAEQLLLDENALAAGQSYFALGVFEVSPDHRYLAYSVDTTGDETYTLVVQDLATGKLLPDRITGTYYSVEWANDNQTLFYTVLDAAKRPYKLFRHQLGQAQSQDVLVYQEPDEAYRVSLSKTKNQTYLLLQVSSLTSSEVHYLAADQPTAEFRVIQPRQPAMRYAVEHHGTQFFILTNDNARNFKLMTVSVDAPAKQYWRDVLPHRDTVKLDSLEVFAKYLVVFEREHGLQRMRVTNLDTQVVHYIDVPEAVYALQPGDNEAFHSQQLRFEYTSLITPWSVFDYDMESKTRVLKKQQEVRGGYNASQYHTERLLAPAADGTLVPVSIVHKKGLVKDGSHPLLLEGYGAYGSSLHPEFASDRLSLLERGFIYAIAHVRGGGELGRPWYEAGKLLSKKNTFSDFIAAAEYLIAAQYTRPDRLIVMGESAGGLLMGVVANMRPELFKAVIARVPFVDVINTMLDPSIPLVVIEYDEWGNPNDAAQYAYMKSYSPYDNVTAQAYPNLLVTAGLHDPRVPYWEPAKWVARLRAMKTDSHRLLLKTDMTTGHGGPSGRYDYLKDLAFTYAFMLDVLGMTD